MKRRLLQDSARVSKPRKWRIDVTEVNSGTRKQPINLLDGDILQINMPPDDGPLIGMEAILRDQRDRARENVQRLQKRIYDLEHQDVCEFARRKLRQWLLR